MASAQAPAAATQPVSRRLVHFAQGFAENPYVAPGWLIQPGDQILFNALRAEAEPSNQPYAEVRRNEQGGWELVNLSPDPWTVQKAGRTVVEPPVGNGASTTLAARQRITFRNGTTATVAIVTATRPAAER